MSLGLEESENFLKSGKEPNQRISSFFQEKCNTGCITYKMRLGLE
jgi:hypothetical protein